MHMHSGTVVVTFSLVPFLSLVLASLDGAFEPLRPRLSRRDPIAGRGQELARIQREQVDEGRRLRYLRMPGRQPPEPAPDTASNPLHLPESMRTGDSHLHHTSHGPHSPHSTQTEMTRYFSAKDDLISLVHPKDASSEDSLKAKGETVHHRTASFQPPKLNPEGRQPQPFAKNVQATRMQSNLEAFDRFTAAKAPLFKKPEESLQLYKQAVQARKQLFRYETKPSRLADRYSEAVPGPSRAKELVFKELPFDSPGKASAPAYLASQEHHRSSRRERQEASSPRRSASKGEGPWTPEGFDPFTAPMSPFHVEMTKEEKQKAADDRILRRIKHLL